MLSRLLTPPRFLMLTYVIGAVLGFVQGIIVARLLGSAAFGVIAILVTIASLTANFWDLRLIDLATKLHYSKAGKAAEQTASMRLLLILNGILGLLMALSAALLIWLGWSLFTDTPPDFSWIVMQASIIGIAFITGTVQSMQRLTDSFYTFAIARLATQVLSLVIMLWWLLPHADITSYYEALLAANVLGLAIALWLLGRLWYAHFGQKLARLDYRSAWPHYRAETKFILSANVFSYSKMLSRSGDILIFGFFASDSATGVYRLARSLADNMNVFVDAVVQFYNPRLMELQAQGKRAEFSYIAGKFFLCAAAVTLLAIPVAFFGLDLINTHFLHDSYAGLGLTTALLAANFIWIAGVHPWLWPVMVHRNEAQRMALTGTAGALLQSGVIAGLCYFVAPEPALAALGAIAYYLVCYTPLLLWWRRV